MSEKFPVISGKDFIKLLEKLGFAVICINGAHHRIKHEDGRIATIPVHKTIPSPKAYFVKFYAKTFKLLPKN